MCRRTIRDAVDQVIDHRDGLNLEKRVSHTLCSSRLELWRHTALLAVVSPGGHPRARPRTAIKMLGRLERDTKRDGARDGTVYGRSLTAAKGFTSHWMRMISASIAGAVGTSISVWAHDMARNLLDIGDLAAIDADAA